MVTYTGKTLHADPNRSVNLPKQVEVEEDSSGLPLAVKIPSRQAVVAIEERWRIDEEWWRNEPISRLYYEVLLSSGQRLEIYKDLIENCWYRQSY